MTGDARGLRALFAPWAQARIGLGLLATLFLQAGRLGAYTFIGVIFARRFGFGLDTLGLVGLLVGAGSLIGSLFTGPILDRLRAGGISGVWTSVVAAIAFVPCAVVAVTADRTFIALAALALWCVFGGSFYSSQQAYLSSADPTQRASVVAWNNSMMNAGIAIGTTLLGLLVAGGAAFAGLTAVFGVLAAVACAGPLIVVGRIGYRHDSGTDPHQTGSSRCRTRRRPVCLRHGRTAMPGRFVRGSQRQPGTFAPGRAAGKGITGGYTSLAVTLVSQAILDAIAEALGPIALGHTMSANPLACATANAVLEVIESGGWSAMPPSVVDCSPRG